MNIREVPLRGNTRRTGVVDGIRSQRSEPAQSIIDALLDDEFTDLLGPHPDEPDVTVRLVRPPEGLSYWVALHGAVCAWVLRRPHLVPEDLE